MFVVVSWEELSDRTKNADLLAKWLNNAKFYISNYRAVPVEEHLVFENAVYPASSSNRFYKTASQLNSQNSGNLMQALPGPHRRIQTSQHKELSNPLINSVVALANETARSGYGVLVFCSSKLVRLSSLPYRNTKSTEQQVDWVVKGMHF